jgi:hypothetical protein
MALEQVFSDHDSEDEVDDDIADFEDRRVRWDHHFALLFTIKYLLFNHCCFNFAEMQMLDDFVDVTKDEKLIMHMWNSFVRKQRSVSLVLTITEDWIFFFLPAIAIFCLTPITCVSHFLCMEQLSGISATECFKCENFELCWSKPCF